MMLHSTALVLVESTDSPQVLNDPANADWLAVVHAVTGDPFNQLACRYYLALGHLRKQRQRSPLPGTPQITAPDKQLALRGMLDMINQHQGASAAGSAPMFVDAAPGRSDETLPIALRDPTMKPPPLSSILSGPGRPPCDALCLLRAFLAAPLMGCNDSPAAVHLLLRSNPTFARACDFCGPTTPTEPGELTSRRLPSLSTCEEFSEVMTRYGLWQLARITAVRNNIASGVVARDDTAAFDTTHIVANSHCDNVVPNPASADSNQPPKQRKVPRLRKRCACGKAQWNSCEHPWSPTDSGAAVVVKGSTRIYWAHKASVVSLGTSEIPVDVRVLLYAADADGKTLLPHLTLLNAQLPEVIDCLRYVLADDAYRSHGLEVAQFGQQARLIVPVHGKKTAAEVAAQFTGIDRFTPSGIPVCEEGYRFIMRGRDISQERFIWAAPDDEHGLSVCQACPRASSCLGNGQRRHIRVNRSDFPQIDWDHPQHAARDRERYNKRTGVERAIKRIKIDLKGAHLTHRDALRVQAHLDRKLLVLHLLLAAFTA